MFDKIDETALASFYDIKQFPMLQAIEDQAQDIIDEWNSVASERDDLLFNWPQEWLYAKDSWGLIPILGPKISEHKNQGVETGIKLQTELFPKTVGILNTTLGNRIESALFSKLNAHSTIESHRGRYSNTLRCQLAIDIPVGDCKIKVGNQVSSWEQGKLLIIDDRLPHEVWNNTNQERIVLIFDFLPDPIPGFFPYEN